MAELEIFANFPDTASAREIQRNYRLLFNRVKRTHKPLLIISNNKPEVAIVGFGDLSELAQKLLDYEEQLALLGIEESRREFRAGKAKLLRGKLSQLWNEG